MKKSLQDAIQEELPNADFPDFEAGDKIRVTTQQDISGQKRKRQFEGVCISFRGEGPDRTFKVRKVSFGIGVERIFPLHSPMIEDIKVLRKGKVRRAKLNYLEGRSAKESRIDEERVDLEELNRTREKSVNEKAESEAKADSGTDEDETEADAEPETASDESTSEESDADETTEDDTKEEEE